jgi:hypothetical protein
LKSLVTKYHIKPKAVNRRFSPLVYENGQFAAATAQHALSAANCASRGHPALHRISL